MRSGPREARATIECVKILPADVRLVPRDDANHDDAVLFENRMLPPAQRWPPEQSRKLDREFPDPTQLRLVALDAAGELVATAFARAVPVRPGSWAVNARVDPRRRHEGIGAHLFDRVEAHARDAGATRLVSLMYEGEPDARAFLERRGYREFWRHAGWALRLASFEPRRFADVETIASEAGVRIVDIRTAIATTPGIEARIQDAHEAILEELPSPVRPPRFDRERYASRLRASNIDIDASAIALRGDNVVGVHIVATTGNGIATSIVTGAVGEGRGRRLGLALKLYALRVLRTRGHEWVATMNDADSAPTLRILRSLGYEQEPALLRFARTV